MSEYAWIDCGDGRSVYRRIVHVDKKRSDLPAPRLNLDTMSPLWHPANGKTYDSKSEFREITRLNGSEEVGNEVQTENRPGSDLTRAEVGEAVRKVKEGYRPSVSETAKDGWN